MSRSYCPHKGITGKDQASEARPPMPCLPLGVTSAPTMEEGGPACAWAQLRASPAPARPEGVGRSQGSTQPHFSCPLPRPTRGPVPPASESRVRLLKDVASGCCCENEGWTVWHLGISSAYWPVGTHLPGSIRGLGLNGLRMKDSSRLGGGTSYTLTTGGVGDIGSGKDVTGEVRKLSIWSWLFAVTLSHLHFLALSFLTSYLS